MEVYIVSFLSITCYILLVHLKLLLFLGLVYNYDETGINKGEKGWEQCINVPLVQPDMYALLKQWDTYLEQFSAAEIWLPYRYDTQLTVRLVLEDREICMIGFGLCLPHS